MRYLALLRGINVGGNNRLPMADLVDILSSLGCVAVQTYIQSGNAIFELGRAKRPGLESRISSGIEQRFGFKVLVFLLSAKEVQAILSALPFPSAEFAHLAILDSPPDPDLVASFNPDRLAGEDFRIEGRVIYFWLPHGVSGSTIMKARFDSRLKTLSTMRNWRTMTELLKRIEG